MRWIRFSQTKLTSTYFMANDNHLILLAGLARKLKLTPKQFAEMLDKDGEKNRQFWNEMVLNRGSVNK